MWAAAARAIGTDIARRGFHLVYGGGNIGLMGVVADAALAAGGRVTGVIPHFLASKELAHSRLSELRLVESMHERKALMADLADAFVALPGGFGTLDEFCEILTWAQLGLHSKPCGLLNVEGFFDPLIGQVEKARDAGFMRPAHAELLIVSADPVGLMDQLEQTKPTTVAKWTDREVR